MAGRGGSNGPASAALVMGPEAYFRHRTASRPDSRGTKAALGASSEVRLRQEQAVGDPRNAGEILLRRGQIVVEVAEYDRGLLQEEALDLARDGPLAAKVEGANILCDERVIDLVLEMRRVPRAVALE